jgi:hypothetical protein
MGGKSILKINMNWNEIKSHPPNSTGHYNGLVHGKLKILKLIW